MLHPGNGANLPCSSGPSEAIARYLQTGEHDVYFSAWDGDLFTRAERATADLKATLITEVRRRAPAPTVPTELRDLDPVAFARRKLTPMVSGLFPRNEQEPVLRMFDRSVVFLVPENIERIIAEATWLATAWDLANLYLQSVGAAPLGDARAGIVGLSEETTCYVSMEYFSSHSRFANFVVHEAAHVFHNCKRRTVGLSETRRREWLLDIDFRRRETFAYSCEAYSRLWEVGAGRGERLRLVDELAREDAPADETVDPEEYVDILRQAVAARNGWKWILDRCSPRNDLPRPSGATLCQSGRV